MKRKSFIAIIAFLAVAFIAACSGETPVDRIVLSETELSMEVGDSETVTADVEPDDADYDELTWTSADTSIVTVDNGTITAVAAGQTSITVAAGGEYAYVAITVTAPVDPDPDPDPEPDPVVAEEVEHDVTDLEVAYGTSETEALALLPGSVVVVDSEGEGHTMDLTWSVSGYEAETAGDYTATGTFSLPADVEQGDISLEVSATITVLADDTAYLDTIGSVNSGFTVPLGSSWSYVEGLLAGTVDLTDNFGETYEVDLTWAGDNYDGEEAGDYTLVATFVLPEGLYNDGHDLEVTATVTVDVERPAVSSYNVELDGYALLLGTDEPLTLTISTDVLGVAGAGEVTLVVGRDTSEEKTRSGDVTFSYNGESFVNHGEIVLDLAKDASHELAMELDFSENGEYELWFQIVDADGEVLQEGDLMATYELEVIDAPAGLTSVNYDDDKYEIIGTEALEDYTLEYATLELLDGETVLGMSEVEALRDSRGKILTQADYTDLNGTFDPFGTSWEVSNRLAVPTGARLTYKVTGLAEQVVTTDDVTALELVSVAEALDEDGETVVVDAVVAYNNGDLIVQDTDGLSMYVDMTSSAKVGERVLVRGTVNEETVTLDSAELVYNLKGTHDVTVLELGSIKDTVLDQVNEDLEASFNPKAYRLENVTFEYVNGNVVMTMEEEVTTVADDREGEDNDLVVTHEYTIMFSDTLLEAFVDVEAADLSDADAFFKAVIKDDETLVEFITFFVSGITVTDGAITSETEDDVTTDYKTIEYDLEVEYIDMPEITDDSATVMTLLEELVADEIEGFESWLEDQLNNEGPYTLDPSDLTEGPHNVPGLAHDYYIEWTSNNNALNMLYREVTLPALAASDATVTINARLLNEDGTKTSIDSDQVVIKSLSTLVREALQDKLDTDLDNQGIVNEDGSLSIDQLTGISIGAMDTITVHNDTYDVSWTTSNANFIELELNNEDEFDGSINFIPSLTQRDGQSTSVTLTAVISLSETDTETNEEEVVWTSSSLRNSYSIHTYHKGITDAVQDQIDNHFDSYDKDDNDRIIITEDFILPVSHDLDSDYEIRWSNNSYFEIDETGNVDVSLPRTGTPSTSMTVTVYYTPDTETETLVSSTSYRVDFVLHSIVEQFSDSEYDSGAFTNVDEDGYLTSGLGNLTSSYSLNGVIYDIEWTNRTENWDTEAYDSDDYIVGNAGTLNRLKETDRTITIRATLSDDGTVVGTKDFTVTVKSQLTLIEEELAAALGFDEDNEVDEGAFTYGESFGNYADFNLTDVRWTTSNRFIVSIDSSNKPQETGVGEVTLTANFEDSEGVKYSKSFTFTIVEEEVTTTTPDTLLDEYEDYDFEDVTIVYGDSNYELPTELTVVDTAGKEFKAAIIWNKTLDNTATATYEGSFTVTGASYTGDVTIKVTVERKTAVSVMAEDSYVYGLETMTEATLISEVIDEMGNIVVTDSAGVKHNVNPSTIDSNFVYFLETYNEEAGMYTLVFVIKENTLAGSGVDHPQVEVEITVHVEAVEEDDEEDEEEEIEVPEGSVVEFYYDDATTDDEDYVIINGEKYYLIGTAKVLFEEGLVEVGTAIEYQMTSDGEIYKLTFIDADLKITVNDLNLIGDLMINGDLAINASGVNLRDIHVLGNLHVATGASVDGLHVTVEGDTLIEGDATFNSEFKGLVTIDSSGTVSFTNVTFAKDVTVDGGTVTIKDSTLTTKLIANSAVSFKGTVKVPTIEGASNVKDEDGESIEVETSVEIDGKVELPGNTIDISETYTLVVNNQFGESMTGSGSAVWTVTTSSAMNIDSPTGTGDTYNLTGDTTTSGAFTISVVYTNEDGSLPPFELEVAVVKPSEE